MSWVFLSVFFKTLEIMPKTKLIKTLPHLHPLFFNKEALTISADYYSFTAKSYLSSVRALHSKEIKFNEILKYLEQYNFEKVQKNLEKLQYSLRGDVLTAWFAGYDTPIRMEFFGNDLEKIYSVDEIYSKKLKDINVIVLAQIESKDDINTIHITTPEQVDLENVEKLIFTNSLQNIEESQYEIIQTDFQFPQLFYSRLDLFSKEIERLQNQGYKIFIKTENEESLSRDLQIYLDLPKEIPLLKNIKNIELQAGFTSEKEKLAVFTDRELFGTIFLTRPERLKKSTTNIQRLLQQFEGNIEMGDYVVHEDYGIGIYSGLTQEMIDGQMYEYLLLKYDKEDELYVPINQIEKITKYIGNEGVEPRLTRLGGVSWENVKNKIKASTRLLARELIEHFAKREISKAKPITGNDSKDYMKFLDEFKHVETDDQIRAINEIVADMEKPVPMDRLLVGDVGFGKTEVFMRAAFKAVEHGGQVAVLAPTTVLTSQHDEVFKERFKSFPIRIESISRFNTSSENKKIIEAANEGKVDILIGTHRLLSSDVKFKNLQLVIVDEEQRFGVKQKEKIKQLNYEAHVLAVSATPIPRTLSMALSTIQEISIITTPPKGRKSISTEIVKDDWNRIAKSIQFEVERGGQVFFLHNKIQNMGFIEDKLGQLVPGLRIVSAHGQMNADKLDKIMDDFYHNKFDVLISTTIIENGLDLPNVNTIVVNNAHRFGLSQLYQLRGRVGRSDRQSYCYLLYQGQDLKALEQEDTQSTKRKRNKKYLERLNSLVENQDLGSGFRIASKDLEIRGAGNLLGEQQSGHIAAIGYALYVELLAQEVEKIRDAVNASYKPLL